MASRHTALFDRLQQLFRQRREVVLLGAATLLLLAAALKPAVPLKRDIHTYLLVVDITQSMNVEDMSVDGSKASRMAYTRRLLHDAVASMPCNTRIGIALFAGVYVSTILHPVEICASYDALQDTLGHLEWRQAWHGNSRLGFGMLSASAALKALQEPAQVVFFTDGEETPRLHAFNRADLTSWQGGRGWLLVGIGGNKPSVVPKLDENNKVLGYWSNNTYQLEPGIAQVSSETRGTRDDAVATQEHERMYSKLDEEYLVWLAKAIHADYVRGDSTPAVLQRMRHLPPARRAATPWPVDWLLGLAAAVLIIITYLPRQRTAHWLQSARQATARALKILRPSAAARADDGMSARPPHPARSP
ncbi:MAG: VWA domain-containing protein [Methylobacterium sp.]|nr:VWA domain-containing protein [Methylobacterium sp.]